jgi:hypothetical protein
MSPDYLRMCRTLVRLGCAGLALGWTLDHLSRKALK